MFEYLMPQLVMPSFENTLLDQTCKSAVSRQIEYGRQRAVPWGISESCYNATDLQQVYQYRAFCCFRFARQDAPECVFRAILVRVRG